MRDDHEAAVVAGEKPLEQLEPGEVEVVRRLVEQQHVGVRGEDRLELRARRLAPREPGRVGLLREMGHDHRRGLPAHRP